MNSSSEKQGVNPQSEAVIDQILNPTQRFLNVETTGGVVLFLALVAAMVLANSAVSESFLNFWTMPLALQVGGWWFRDSLQHLINGGLMTIFFFVVGLEVKRELVLGELKELRQAALPMAAAIGGMVVPAGVYLVMQLGRPGQSGWGIPMATDIALVVGCMAILGKRVPHSLRVLMLSLAIVDDVGAILVIAIGYSHGIQGEWLAIALGGLAVVWVASKIGIRNFFFYAACGVCIWFAFHESGIHATLAGVALGMMTPVRTRLSEGHIARLLSRAKVLLEGGEWLDETQRVERLRRFQLATREAISPVEYLLHVLHPWVSLVIMPLFVLANAGVALHFSEMNLGIVAATGLGLLVGKPLGIVAATWLAVRTGMTTLPADLTWRHVTAGGALGGIGFTMAMFIADLALHGELLESAKVGILIGSLLSAVLGIGLLATGPRSPETHKAAMT